MFANLRYKLLALFLAILFWIFIISTQNTFSKFPDPITIKPFNLSEQLTLVNKLGEANVIIRTTPETYKKITAKDFELYIDLKGLQIGEYEMPVSVTSENPDVTILKVEPAKIKIKLEPLISKNIPVVLKLEGKTKEDYQPGEADLSITTVKISGAQSIINTASQAQAILELKGDETTDIEKALSLKIVDADENKLENIKLAEDTVDVFLPVAEVYERKTVDITAKINKYEGFQQKDITVSPSTTPLKGKKEILEKINFLETNEIDFEKLREQNSLKVNLNIPEGVNLVNPNDILVTVILNIQEVKNTKNTIARIKLNNQNFTVNPDFIELTLEGVPDLLNNIKETDYYVTISLTGIETNSQKIEITSDMITAPEGIEIIDFNPKFVEVIKL